MQIQSVTLNAKPRIQKILVAFVILLSGWLTYDFFASRQTSLRQFDPEAVAQLETKMWRSYYNLERAALFLQLVALLREQYHMSLSRSCATAYHAAKAAFVFKRGKARTDYEKALPDLVAYYAAIRAMSDTPFDVERVAQLELEWWIIHRQRAQHQAGDLETALAELQAALFNLPAERFREHARLRTEAMDNRDNKAEHGGVTESDWQRIDELLKGSWRSLWLAVH
jgi:hypothetical protein